LIVVADYSRIEQGFTKEHAKHTLDKFGMWIVAANDYDSEGEHTEAAALRRKNARDERAERSRRMVASRRSAGLPLGNMKNLPAAQRKGAASVKRAARLRGDEFDDLDKAAAALGFSTASEFAGWLNKAGRLTARGKSWTKENIYSNRQRGRARKVTTVKPVPATTRVVYDSERRMIPASEAVVKAIMVAKGWEPRHTGKLMRELGLNPSDATVFTGCRHNEEKAEKMQAWVDKNYSLIA
jgi:hypothetical protein